MEILIDYFGFSSKQIPLKDFMDLFGFNKLIFKNIRSNRRYAQCQWYPGVSIHSNTPYDWHIELSGSGCRVVENINESFTWDIFLRFIKPFLNEKLIHISRMDVACDDKEMQIKYSKLIQHLRQDKYISKSRYIFWSEGVEEAIYIGSPKSDKRLRIYNKALQQDVEGHWIRYEFQLRNDEALEFLLNFYNCQDIGRVYKTLLYDTIRFTNEVVDKDNNHHSRATTTVWWIKFVDLLNRINYIHLPGKKYTEETLINYIKKNCGSSIKTYLHLSDGDVDGLLGLLKGISLNKNQEMLIQELNIKKLKEESDINE